MNEIYLIEDSNRLNWIQTDFGKARVTDIQGTITLFTSLGFTVKRFIEDRFVEDFKPAIKTINDYLGKEDKKIVICDTTSGEFFYIKKEIALSLNLNKFEVENSDMLKLKTNNNLFYERLREKYAEDKSQ